MADADVSAGEVVIVTFASGVSAAAAAGVGSWFAIWAYRDGRFSRGWWWLRVSSLGGVTTLKQALGYDCGLCRRSLDQGEEVRTLSCDHVFHFRKSAKCVNIIDNWLRENSMFCPVCCKIAYPVLPWKAPPTSPPPPPPSTPPEQRPSTPTIDLEAQVPQAAVSVGEEASAATVGSTTVLGTGG
ncbi:hypothetical protein BS78_06G142500 [Paspalum vaginatum]|nr:hypothetical protein BS78_06G142500 [Paspalum vaginatum]